MKKALLRVLSIVVVLVMFLIPSTPSQIIFSNEFKELIFDESQKIEVFSLDDIIIDDVKGGRSLSFNIKNDGDRDYNNIDVITRVSGGLIIPPRIKNHEILLLTSDGPFSTESIKNKIFGFGLPNVFIEIDFDGDKIIIAQLKLLVFGSFVIVLESILNEKNLFEGYTLFTPEYSTDTYLINNYGEIVHKWDGKYIQGMSTYLLENGNLIRTECSKPIHPNLLVGGFTGHVGIYNPEGSLVWDFTYSNSEHCLHHDIEILPNGNILMIAAEYKGEAEVIENGRDRNHLNNKKLCPDYIIEVKPNETSGGEIVWQWHVWDHLIQDYDSSKKNYGDVGNHPELIDINYGSPYANWNHINSIDYNEEFDQILLSVLEFNEIWVIDHSTTKKEAASHTGGRYGKGGDILYRWGNPQTYRAGNKEDQKLFLQHDATWIESDCPGNGNILIFNNKNEKIDEINPNLRYYSSVDEIVTPVDRNGNYYKIGKAYGPINPTWSYTSEGLYDFYSPHLSGAQRLPNGNTLICEGAKGKFFEVTHEKGLVWQYQNNFGTLNHVFDISKYSPSYPGVINLLD